jgi:hypothetical protein
MRWIRNQLENDLTRILNQDQKALFDQENLRRTAQEGGFAVGNTDPVFLVVVTRSGANDQSDGLQLHDCALIRGTDEAVRWAFNASKSIGGYTMFEVATSAHDVVDQLARITPRRRGRAG